MIGIGVGICNFNRADLVSLAVQSALDQGSGVRRVLVADNASTDGSVGALAEIRDPRLRVVRMPENQGGAGGFRTVSRVLLGEEGLEALALVDSDCLLAEGCLLELAARIEAGAEIVGPKVLFAEQPHVIQEVGGDVDWSRAGLVHRYRGHNETTDGAVTGCDQVDFVASCALLARREVFEAVGHFRPEYFLYFDDVEWCLRAGAAGFKVQAAGEARAFHHGGSARKQSNLPTYYAWRNRVHCFLEHTTDREGMRQVLLGEVAQAVATCRVFGQTRCAEVICEATRDGLGGLTGRCRLSSEELALDESVGPEASAIAFDRQYVVDHIFESLPPKGHSDTFIRDRFGKSGTLQWIESSRPEYQVQKRKVIHELGACERRG